MLLISEARGICGKLDWSVRVSRRSHTYWIVEASGPQQGPDGWQPNIQVLCAPGYCAMWEAAEELVRMVRRIGRAKRNDAAWGTEKKKR